MFSERVRILINHTGKVRKTSLYVTAFNYGRPQLIFPILHGEFSSKSSLFSRGVLAAITSEPRRVFLLLSLDGKMKAAAVCRVLTGAVYFTKLRRLCSGDVRMAQLTAFFEMCAL